MNKKTLKANHDIQKASVKFVEKFQTEIFSHASNYENLLKKLIQYKRLARIVLRGEII